MCTYPDVNALPRLPWTNKRPNLNSVSYPGKDSLEVWSPIERPRAKVCHRIILGTRSGVESDVVKLVDAELLGDVHAYTEEIGCLKHGG